MPDELSTQDIILGLMLSKEEYKISKNKLLDNQGFLVGEIDSNRKINIHYDVPEEEIEKISMFKKFLKEENIPYKEGIITKNLAINLFKKKADYYNNLIKKIEE